MGRSLTGLTCNIRSRVQCTLGTRIGVGGSVWSGRIKSKEAPNCNWMTLHGTAFCFIGSQWTNHYLTITPSKPCLNVQRERREFFSMELLVGKKKVSPFLLLECMGKWGGDSGLLHQLVMEQTTTFVHTCSSLLSSFLHVAPSKKCLPAPMKGYCYVSQGGWRMGWPCLYLFTLLLGVHLDKFITSGSKAMCTWPGENIPC